MVDRNTETEHDRSHDGSEHKDLGEKLKALSDKIGCAANAPLENFEKDDDD